MGLSSEGEISGRICRGAITSDDGQTMRWTRSRSFMIQPLAAGVETLADLFQHLHRYRPPVLGQSVWLRGKRSHIPKWSEPKRKTTRIRAIVDALGNRYIFGFPLVMPTIARLPYRCFPMCPWRKAHRLQFVNTIWTKSLIYVEDQEAGYTIDRSLAASMNENVMGGRIKSVILSSIFP